MVLISENLLDIWVPTDDSFTFISQLAQNVRLVRQIVHGGQGPLFALKSLSIGASAASASSIQDVKNERIILEAMIGCPRSSQLQYAFKTESTLNLVTGW